MLTTARRTAKTLGVAAAIPAALLLAGTSVAAASSATAGAPARPAHSFAHHAGSSYQVRQILSGKKLRHTFVLSGKRHSEPLTKPDDITALGRYLYAGFQNGVGPQGQPSTDGNTFSTVVEFTPGGKVVRQWDVRGKDDGNTADPARHRLIVTVNEDRNSSIYTITPGAPAAVQVQHYRYGKPLPHNGGTDAISVYRGLVVVSASAPGTTGKPAPQPNYPAVYVITFHHATHVATFSPVFSDEASATVANPGPDHGKTVRLALTDPDSNSVVPGSSPRFGGDFMLDSQGDLEQIFVEHGKHGRRLQVLRLQNSVDDTAWAVDPFGRLYGSDPTADTIDVVTGRFAPHTVITAVTPCNANSAPSTCPAPGFPPNYLGSLNLWTGQTSRITLHGPAFHPVGLVFVR